MGTPAAKAPFADDPHAPVWRVMRVVGLVLAVVGGLDLLVLWLPANLGAPEWEFGTASTSFDAFPQLGLGVVLLLAASVALGHRGTIRGVAGLCVGLSLLIWLGAYRYVTAFPYMLQVSSDPDIHDHVQKAAAKAGVQTLVYPLLLVLLAIRGWRATLRPRLGVAR